MPAHKVLMTDHPWTGTEIEQQILRPLDIEIVDAPDDSEETLCGLAGDVEAIITCWGKVTEQVIATAGNCRLICRMGIGLDNIAVATASRRNIPVTNVPDYCIDEVADHAWALLLALTRNIAWQHLKTKQGVYSLAAAPPMHRMKGRTLGLVGFGRIGQTLFHRAQAFGLHVIAHTPSGNDYGTGCAMASLSEVLSTADYLSLHAPATEETEHLVNAQRLAQMKPGAVLINTARGSLIDEDALFAAIQTGQIAGAGLDVFSPEPPDLDRPLFRHERVIATPHAAFVSEESLVELRERVARQVADLFEGKQPAHIVNRDELRSG